MVALVNLDLRYCEHRYPHFFMTRKPGELASDAAKAGRAHLIGIALMCAAVGAFASLDTTAKYLGRDIDAVEIAWARYAFAFLVTLPFSNPLSRPGLVRTGRPLFQIGRAAILAGSSVLNFFALKFLRLDQVLAISFSTPLFVAALSGPALGEWVGARRWAAIAMGFAGVLVVTRPGFGVHPAVFVVILSTLAYAAYFLMTRALSRSDSNETTLFYSNFVGAALLLPALPFVWTWLGLAQLALLILAGALGSFGHYLLIAAHRYAPASLLSGFVYFQLIYVVTLGYLVFGDVPDRTTLAGAAIVIASGLFMLRDEQIRGRRAEKRL
jgi:drug/metabolite transporter (DMT)-like permease